MNAVTIVVWIVAVGLSVPAGVFCAQCLASLLPQRRNKSPLSRPPVAILTPAHNEQAEIPATLSALMRQLRAGDIALVVADNCTDGTADAARLAGAEVLERSDPAHRGKGFALAAGIEALRAREYEVLVVLDADCRLESGAIDALAAQVARSSHPAQAVYLMETCPDPSPRDRVSAWAFMVKNLVRPMGLSRLGLPCPLTGTGMAFPRATIEKARLATGNIVEDMQLGLDLALAGAAPRLCPDARVMGRLPRDRKTAIIQRRRWEHGHLHTLLRQSPRMLIGGMLRARPGAIALGIDLLVPPISLLVLLLIGATIASGILAVITHVTAQWAASGLLLAALLAVSACVMLAWAKYGRRLMGLGGLLAVAGYVLWKLPMYVMFLFRREKKWVRTDRDDSDHPLSDPPKSPATI